MNQTKINVLLALAMLTGASSLPMDWFTLTDVVVDDTVFAGSISALQGATLFSIPAWVLVAIALVACALQLLEASGLRHVPKALKWTPAVVAVLGMSLAIGFPLVAQGVTANAGAFLGFLSSVIPTLTLALRRRESNRAVEQ
ncbi:MAG: hypothetical protein U0V87_05055 [Acidobacteriota bacterium]